MPAALPFLMVHTLSVKLPRPTIISRWMILSCGSRSIVRTRPQVWRVLLDEEFEAKLKIIKQDDETKKPVLQEGTEFRIYDLDNKEYVEQVTTYPTTVVHTSFFTDEEGYLILPQNLKSVITGLRKSQRLTDIR